MKAVKKVTLLPILNLPHTAFAAQAGLCRMVAAEWGGLGLHSQEQNRGRLAGVALGGVTLKYIACKLHE